MLNVNPNSKNDSAPQAKLDKLAFDLVFKIGNGQPGRDLAVPLLIVIFTGRLDFFQTQNSSKDLQLIRGII